ncbi:sulfite exporter TauE/SafE family protein [Hymenobacter lutimineralis]|uniref:Sulfite exporter TauE/SafE family protein n=1 Tax=Hymenobacter lutimineralis TaxID=2606448 RepID=A0A5D6UT76_9BACT|nr:sulfite exporter TauE/SafE family protein [Hymenobacter lutimineralis]TYZ06911.1 sulfite exporter TauE/SafE family protein [Hymenobacter lutimineralis]
MLWAGFLFGFLGSFHCVGMCGAIALALPGQGNPVGWRYVRGRVLYNLGRVTTYSLLGAVAGMVGQGLRLAGWQQGLSIASGLLILLLVAVPERYTSRASMALGLSRGLGAVKNQLGYYFQQPTARALYTTGLLNGLLPCGMVYLALAGAISAPGVPGAVLYMALFGLGTVPLMLALSLSGQLVPLPWRMRLRQAVPVMALGLAALFILRGLGLGIPYLSPQLGTAGAVAAPVGQPASVHYCQSVPQAASAR